MTTLVHVIGFAWWTFVAGVGVYWLWCAWQSWQQQRARSRAEVREIANEYLKRAG
jgi:hypothetical protein